MIIYTKYNGFELWQRFTKMQGRPSLAQKIYRPSAIWNTDLRANVEQE
jgi:hypothetical protein